MLKIVSKNIDDTKEIGMAMAPYLNKDTLITLSGDLGAGKTALVSGILKYFGKENEASSPTFTIINEHLLHDDLKLFHFDVYRFDNENEFTGIGGEEFFGQGVCIIEWAEKIQSLLPDNYLRITIEKNLSDENERTFIFEPLGEKYDTFLKEAFN